MATDVREAAERLRQLRDRRTEQPYRNAVQELYSIGCYKLGQQDKAVLQDKLILTDAYLAEYQPDDNELVNADWLRSVQFTDVDGEWFIFSDHLVEILFNSGLPPKIVLRVHHDHFIMNDPTRGDVRLLCRVLGCELKVR